MRTLLPILGTEEAHEIVCQAYTFGYPLVLMDAARQVMTDVSMPDQLRAPLNQFAHGVRPSVVHGAYPNTDVLSSVAWLSVGREPIVLTVPDMGHRYYAMRFMDAWTNVFATIGSHELARRSLRVAILGPRWSGKVHASVRTVASPTNIVRLLADIETFDVHDDAAAQAQQHGLGLLPLGLWEHDHRSLRQAAMPRGLDVRLSPSERVARMEGAEFFERLNTLMTDNPPAPEDSEALDRFAAVGIGPGLPFDLRDDAAGAKSVDASTRTALARIVLEARQPPGRTATGWWIPAWTSGESDYLKRAAAALSGLGADRPEDIVSLRGVADASGRSLSGANRYVLRFRERQRPPVHGFWSLTMYNARQALVQNPLDRHAICSRHQLSVDVEGSLTAYIQHAPPDRSLQSNWLPAPHDQFTLMLRLYRPGPAILDGTWVPPGVERVSVR